MLGFQFKRTPGQGTAGDATVHIKQSDGKLTPLPLRLDLANYSPTGFQWGYSGSGPTQLALAMCAYILQDNERALRDCYYVRDKFLVNEHRDSFLLTQHEIVDACIEGETLGRTRPLV